MAASPEVMAALARYRQQIREVAANALVSLTLYGGVVRGRYEPQRSDINVLLVLQEITNEMLDRLAPVLRAAWREIRLEPFLLAWNEVPRAAVLFPTKMLDIQRFHHVLDGQEVLSGLEIRRQDLSLRLEQELRNLGLRLRRRFLAIEQDDAALQRALLGTAVPLRVALLAMLDLAGAQLAGEERTAAVYAHAASQFKLDAAALAELSRLRDTGSAGMGGRELYLAVMKTVTQAAEIVTQTGSRP